MSDGLRYEQNTGVELMDSVTGAKMVGHPPVGIGAFGFNKYSRLQSTADSAMKREKRRGIDAIH